MARSRREALADFLAPLRVTLSCISRDQIMVIDGGSRSPDRLRVVANNYSPVWIDVGDPLRRVGLIVGFEVDLLNSPKQPGGSPWWTASVAAYMHSVVDEQEKELYAYHWHPHGVGEYVEPHLHVGPQLCYGTPMVEAHFPTGRIGIEQIVRMLINEWGAATLRDNWAVTLDRIEATERAR